MSAAGRSFAMTWGAFACCWCILATASAAAATLAARAKESGCTGRPTRVEGSTYINDSFGFEMFKPPNWKVLESTAQSVPSAVAVMGTEDEASMMLVGSVVFDGPASAYAAVLDASLKRLYSDYVRNSEEQVIVAGLPAIRRSFRGMADEGEWHGVAVNLADGKNHYGFIGVTSGEAYQFKSSVMGKMIASFKFR